MNSPLTLKKTPLAPRALARVPGSKSLSLRNLFLAGLANGTSKLQGVADCDDVNVMLQALKTLGVPITGTFSEFSIKGGGGTFMPGQVSLSSSLSGVSARLLVALGALRSDKTTVDGEAPLRMRPFHYLADALRDLGFSVSGEREGYLPLTVKGGSQEKRDIRVKGDISSQFFSALFLIAPLLPKGLTVEVEGDLVSRPYLEMTVATMSAFGVEVNAKSDFSFFQIEPQQYTAQSLSIEPDASGASYFLALATLHGTTIEIPHLASAHLQGDLAFLSICKKLGAKVERNGSSLIISGPEGGKLPPLHEPVDFTEMPDVAPTLMALAPFIPSTTKLVGLSTLRIKECDRITAPATELRKCGVPVREGPDWIEIDELANLPDSPPTVSVDTYHDHRMAMSLAVFASKRGNVVVNNPEVVGKTFPQFWEVLRGLESDTN